MAAWWGKVLIFAPLWGLLSDRAGTRKPFIVAGFLASGLLYTAFGFIDSVGLLLAVRFVQGAMSVMGWSTLMASVLDHVGDHGLGQTFALAASVESKGVGDVGGGEGRSSQCPDEGRQERPEPPTRKPHLSLEGNRVARSLGAHHGWRPWRAHSWSTQRLMAVASVTPSDRREPSFQRELSFHRKPPFQK